MKIDWKVVAQSPGYKSLKATMIRAIQRNNKEIQKWPNRRPMRSKDAFKKHFNWVISRAIQNANYRKVTLDVVLNEWESKRDYCWLNFYQESRQPKLFDPINKKKPIGIRTYAKKDIWYKDNPIKKKAFVFKHLMWEQKQKSKRKDGKARWTKQRKNYQKKYGKI